MKRPIRAAKDQGSWTKAKRNQAGAFSLHNTFAFILLVAAILAGMGQTGCIGLTGAQAPPSNGPTPQPQISFSPSSVDFGSVAVGGNVPRTVVISNPGGAALVLSSASATGTGFSLTSMTTPATVNAGQSLNISVKFTPSAAGSASGSVNFVTNATGSPQTISLTGTGVAAASVLTVIPTSINFGNVNVGANSSQTVTLSNTGSSSLSISQALASGTGFSMSGIATPITLAAGQNTTLTAKFMPTTSGNASGNITITSNASNSSVVIPLSGTAIQPQAAISITPSPVSFGSVNVGSNATQNMTITNSGTAALSITQLTASGTGYSVLGFSLPISVAAGQTSTFTSKFAPTTAGAANGSISITSNAPGSPLTVSMSGTGVQATISAIPSTVGFGNVIVGAPNSQTVTLHNGGTASLTISQATTTGTGVSISGLSIPATLAAGANATLNVTFSPVGAGAISGSVVLTSNAPTSPLTIPVTGTGVAATRVINVSASNLTFGNINVSSNSVQNVTLTNNGNSNVTISNIGTSGAGYSASGVANGTTLSAGQSTSLSVTFAPTIAGAASGNVTITSNASNSPGNISLTGTGIQTAISHSVTLSWTASTSTVVGYNIYRSTVPGGPYTLVTSSPVSTTTYTDTTVQAGVTYYYVVTAVDASGNESVYSNEASASVPTP